MILVTYTREAPNGFDISSLILGFLSSPSSLTSLSVSSNQAIFSATTSDEILILNGVFSGGTIDDLSGVVSSVEAQADDDVIATIEGLSTDIRALIDTQDPGLLFDGQVTFNGSTGIDIFSSEAGNDFLLGGNGNDTLNSGRGDDFISGELGRDVIFAGQGADTIDGGEEDDLIDYSLDGGNGGVTLNLNIGTAIDAFGDEDTLTSIEDVTGTEQADRIFGDGVDNTLTGLGGDDVVNGRAGDDRIFGGDGEDVLVGGDGDDGVWGDDGDDVLGGRVGDDMLNGGNGDDRIFGQLGDDVINGGFGDDAINGGVGDDVIRGNSDNDTILGRDGADTLLGGFGDDRLNGGTGEDILEGGAGNDTLLGRADSDTFVYATANFGDDIIFGYSTEDVIEISSNLAADFDALTIVSLEAGDTRIEFARGTITLRDFDEALTAEDFSFI